MCVFISCSKNYCLTPFIGEVAFIVNDTIPDTSALLVQYTKGRNFTTVEATYTIAMYRSSQTGYHYGFGFPYFVGSGNGIAYDYDWEFTLLPSGKVYKLKNISHTNNYTKGYGEVKENCVNTVNYNVNDSLYSDVSSPVSSSSASATLSVKY